jgi:Tfp pilus assembly major pilin PilA
MVMTVMTRISALSTILALGLWVGPAAAGDINTDSPAADDTLVANGDQLDPGQMSAATGGHVDESNVAVATATNVNTFSTDNGGQINTGSLNSNNNNSGGITVSLLNTGNGVVMQNATNINIFLAPQGGNGP